MNINNLKKEEIINKDVISFFTFNGSMELQKNDNKLNKNVYKYNYNYINNEKNKNYVDVLYVHISDININKVSIDKTITKWGCIYSVSFTNNLIVHINENGNVIQHQHDFYIAHSFEYEDANIDVDIYPISFGCQVGEFRIDFYITYAYVDVRDGNTIEDLNEKNNRNYQTKDHMTRQNKDISSYDISSNINNNDLNTSDNNEGDYSKYTYINISKEFI